MARLSYCIMCLGTEIKMFTFNPTLLRIYKQFISTDVQQLNIKLMHACYECAYLLHKYERFRTKCCKAYSILCNLSPGQFEVKQEDFNHIDRKLNNLESVLTACTTINYYQPDQQNGDSGTDGQFYNGIVKTESVLIRVQEPSNEDTFNIQNLQSSITDPITFDNTLSNQSNLLSKANKAENNKRALDEYAEEDDYSLHMLKKVRSNNLDNFEKTKDGSSETGQVISNENNTESLIKFNVQHIYKNSDNECVILDEHPIEDTVEMNISETEKRKYDFVNKQNVYRQARKKRNSKNNINDRHIKKISLEKKGKIALKIIDKTNEEGRFSINSSIFKEYMSTVELTPEDAKTELLVRKESKNYKMNLYKCDLCYRGFISQSTYETHMKKHSLEYGSLKCDICQLSFTENRYLSNHRIVCHTRKFLCKICPYVCFGANQARAHIRSHKGKKYTCKECGEIFRFPNSLSTHMRLRHSVELVCDFCGSTFASQKGLDCHKRLIHREQENSRLGPQCVECNVHFASELAWKRHRVLCSRHHVGDGCGVCGEIFPDARGLRTHLRQHGPLPTTWNSRLRTKAAPPSAPSAPQPCAHCNKELRSKKEYKIHMASEHPQVAAHDIPTGFGTPLMNWVCEVCGKTFKHHSLFISHQRKHTGEKPFSCPECGKRFKRADAVKAHRPLHTNDYTFKCHLCDKAYGDRGKLNRHVKGHLGIRPYKCRYCDKSFLYQCVVNAHTKYVHCKEPYPKRDRSKRTGKAKTK